MTAGAYSIPEVQRLVATLVASKPGGRIAEIGTSYGDGASAIAAALQEGDWRRLLPSRAPFDVVFADGGVGYDRVAGLLAPGGILVKDDLTPGGRVEGDAAREALLRDPRLEATEVLVTPAMSCIVAVRRT